MAFDSDPEKRRRGRPVDPDPILFMKGTGQPELGARLSQRLWLGKWSGNTQNAQLQEVLERSMLFWPDGPDRVGREVKQSRYRAPQRVNTFAQRNGYSRSEALAVIAKRYVEEHPEEFE